MSVTFTAYLHGLNPAEVGYSRSGGSHILRVSRDVMLIVAGKETAVTAAGLRKLAEAATEMADALSGQAPQAGDGEPSPFTDVPPLRRVLCARTVVTDGNPEPCGLPVDHEPDEKCPGNPHARPATAPEAKREAGS